MAPVKKSDEPSTGSPAGSRELYRDAYVVLLFDERLALVRFARTATPFPNLAAVEQTYNTTIGILDRLGRAGRRLLTDVRAAPGRNDPDFEALMLKLRPRIRRGFERLGMLVATAVGAMHLRRLTKQTEGIDSLISADEAELVRYLTEPKDR